MEDRTDHSRASPRGHARQRLSAWIDRISGTNKFLIARIDCDAARTRLSRASAELDELLARDTDLKRQALAPARGIDRIRNRNRAEREEIQNLAQGIDRLRRDVEQLTSVRDQKLQELERAQESWVSRRAWIGPAVFLALQFWVVVYLLLDPVLSAQDVHMEFYEAVAAIAPILLGAGLVELTIVAGRNAGSRMLAFAIAPSAAVVGSLVALARHRSTSATFGLSAWGLLSGVLLLLLFTAFHAGGQRMGIKFVDHDFSHDELHGRPRS